MTCNKHNKNTDLNNKLSIGSYADLDAAYNVSDTMSEFENRVNPHHLLNDYHKKLPSSMNLDDFYPEQDNNFDDVLSPESEYQINKNIDQLLISNYTNTNDQSCQKNKVITHNPIPSLPNIVTQHPKTVEPFISTNNNNICMSKVVFFVVVIILLIIGIYLLTKNSSKNATTQTLIPNDFFPMSDYY